MAEEFQEYITFTVTNKDGQEVEMAVVDEFDFDHKHYVVGAMIEGDTINEEGMYIYRAKLVDDGFVAEKIESSSKYQEIAEAYMAMEQE